MWFAQVLEMLLSGVRAVDVRLSHRSFFVSRKAMTLAKSVRSRLPLVFNALKVKKTKLRSAVSVVCLLRLWHLNRVWSVTFWVVVTDYFLLGQQTVLLLQSIGSTIWKLVFGSFSTCPNLLSLAILAAGVHYFRSGNRFVHHVAVRHGNMTSVRDRLLMNIFRTLGGSNPLWFDGYVLMILLWTWRIKPFCISYQSLAQGRLQLEPFGLAGDFAKHRWSPQCFQISSGTVHDFVTKIIVGNRIIASLFSCRVQVWFFSCRFICGFTLWDLWPDWTFFWPHGFLVCCDLFLRQSALNPHISFWWISAEQRESCHTDPWFRQWLVSICVPTIIDGRLLKYINARFRLSLNTNVNQMYGKIVLRNREFRPWSNMIPIYIFNLP